MQKTFAVAVNDALLSSWSQTANAKPRLSGPRRRHDHQLFIGQSMAPEVTWTMM